MTVTPFRLHKGDLLLLDDRLHEVTRTDGGGMNLLPLAGGSTPVHLTHDEAIRRYFDGTGSLKIARGAIAPLPEGLATVLDTPIDWFPLKDQDEALMRLDYVSLCESYFLRGKAARTPQGYARVGRIAAWRRRRQAAREAGKPASAMPLERFGGTTIRDWHWRWTKAGRVLNALIPMHHRKGPKQSGLDPAVDRIIGNRIPMYYLTLESPPLTVVHEAIEGDVEEHNAATGEQLSVPSLSTLRRWVKANVSEFDLVHDRKGPRAAEQHFRHLKKPPSVTRPLETIQVDHTLLDLQTVTGGTARQPGERLVRRLWLTTAICVATRMIVGFHLSYERPSWTSVMECLRMAVLPKDPLLQATAMSSPWPVYGIPEIVVVDNGLEFHSRSMKAAAGHLGFELRYAPVRKPHLKGVVERNLGEVARNFLAFLPGRTFRDVRERGQYPSEEAAALTLEEVREAFLIWVVDYYHNRPHGGLHGVTPLTRWDDLSGYGVRLPPQASDLDALIGLVIERQIRRDGITYLGLTYQSSDLRTMRRRPGHAGKLWMVKLDPLDLSHALVLDEARKKWISVPSDDPELTDGLTLAEWRGIVEEAKSRAEKSKRVSRNALLEARRRLIEIGERSGAGKRTPVTKQDLDWADEYSSRSAPVVLSDGVEDEPDPRQRRRNARRRGGDGPAAPVSEGYGMPLEETAAPPVGQRTLVDEVPRLDAAGPDGLDADPFDENSWE